MKSKTLKQKKKFYRSEMFYSRETLQEGGQPENSFFVYFIGRYTYIYERI